MSLQSERLELLMQRLSLADMAQRYQLLAEQAAQKNLPYCGHRLVRTVCNKRYPPYCDFLEQVLEGEYHARQERNVKVASINKGSNWTRMEIYLRRHGEGREFLAAKVL
jgi:hypothetical protein